MKKTLFFYWIPFIFVIHILSFGALAQSSAPQTISVGAIVSLSGFDSNLGGQAQAGYEIAAEEINKAGGVFVKEFGKKIP